MDANGRIADEVGRCASVFVFGASGYGRAMSFVLQYGFSPSKLCAVAGFIDDEEGGRGISLDGVPVLSLAEWRQTSVAVPVLVSVGSPRARASIVRRLVEADAIFTQLYHHLPTHVFPGVGIGTGTFIGPSTYIGPLTTIGDHAQIMSACSIGHDVEIGEFCTICPSCTISGYVVIEPGVFVGAGSTIVNGKPGSPIRIGEGAKISAGSVVTKSVPKGGRIAGNPARPLREIALDHLRVAS